MYNSCQSGVFGSSGFASNKSGSAQCKVVFENGALTKLEFPAERPPSAFEERKVQLNDSSLGRSKSLSAVQVPRGTKLSVILNNRCVQESEESLDQTVVSRLALIENTLMPDLDRQAYLMTLDKDYDENELEALASAEPCVIGVSWNQEYKFQAMTFNDSSAANQTYHASIRAKESYDLFYNSTGGMGSSGTPVILADIDTGVDWQHPDLQANMWAHTDGVGIDITTLNSGLVNYNPTDISNIGHGTHVAGLMAAVSGNGLGIVGTMPQRAKIMAIKIFKSDGQGGISTTSQHFYNAIQFAYLNGANVINLSLGSLTSGPATDSVAKSAVEEAVQRGVFVTTVIGNADGNNSGALIDGVSKSSIPAQYSTIPGVIGVASYDVQSGLKSSFSHYSPVYAEISAPGAEYGTTGILSTVPVSQGSYGRLAGTSQAGPLVSAAAGLVYGILKEANNGVGPSPAEVERLILASAIKNSNLTTFFKDGNKLDLLSLAQKINQDYPSTRPGGVPAPGTNTIPSGCSN